MILITIYTQIEYGFLLLKNMEKCCIKSGQNEYLKSVLSGENSILFLTKIFQFLKVVFLKKW